MPNFEPYCRCPGCGTCKACDVVTQIEKALKLHLEMGKEMKEEGMPVPDFAHVVRRILRKAHART